MPLFSRGKDKRQKTRLLVNQNVVVNPKVHGLDMHFLIMTGDGGLASFRAVFPVSCNEELWSVSLFS